MQWVKIGPNGHIFPDFIMKNPKLDILQYLKYAGLMK